MSVFAFRVQSEVKANHDAPLGTPSIHDQHPLGTTGLCTCPPVFLATHEQSRSPCTKPLSCSPLPLAWPLLRWHIRPATRLQGPVPPDV